MPVNLSTGTKEQSSNSGALGRASTSPGLAQHRPSGKRKAQKAAQHMGKGAIKTHLSPSLGDLFKAGGIESDIPSSSKDSDDSLEDEDDEDDDDLDEDDDDDEDDSLSG